MRTEGEVEASGGGIAIHGVNEWLYTITVGG